MDDNQKQLLRALPGVDTLLGQAAMQPLLDRYGQAWVVRACREALDGAREQIRLTGSAPTELIAAVRGRLEARATPSLRPVINATGVVIHTNLGRAPLSHSAIAAMAAVGGGYSNLEFDIESGRRGSRYEHVGAQLAEVSGAEAGLVVNNNAAALVLALATLAAGREVLVSRAHLVEIGGGFRIPDIMRQSGALLREVGTTNRTYTRDFTEAAGADTALFLRVHPSNFRIEGFVHQPQLKELAAAAHARGMMLMDDVGSGALLDTSRYGLAREPMVQESIAAGADLVLFSGDKLVGGPQAGCLVGSHEVIGRLRRHPLARALRVDKSTLAGLDATLRSYQQGRAIEELPVWQMIARPEGEIQITAHRWAATLEEAGLSTEVRRGVSTIGGGSLPGETLPTWLLALPGPHASAWAARLRHHHPAVVARLQDDEVVVDPRTVLAEQEDALLAALRATRPDGAVGQGLA